MANQRDKYQDIAIRRLDLDWNAIVTSTSSFDFTGNLRILFTISKLTKIVKLRHTPLPAICYFSSSWSPPRYSKHGMSLSELTDLLNRLPTSL